MPLIIVVRRLRKNDGRIELHIKPLFPNKGKKERKGGKKGMNWKDLIDGWKCG